MILKVEVNFKCDGEGILPTEDFLRELSQAFTLALGGGGCCARKGPRKKPEYCPPATVRSFITKCVEIDPGGKTGKATAYAEYLRLCSELNMTPAGETYFRLAFLRFLREQIEVRDGKLPADDAGRRANAYVGIRLLEENNEEVDDFPAPLPSPPEAAHV